MLSSENTQLNICLTSLDGRRQPSCSSTTSCLICASAATIPPSPPGSFLAPPGFLRPAPQLQTPTCTHITRSSLLAVGPRAAGRPWGPMSVAASRPSGTGASGELQTSFDTQDVGGLIAQTTRFCVTRNKANKQMSFCKPRHALQNEHDLHLGLFHISIWERSGKNDR